MEAVVLDKVEEVEMVEDLIRMEKMVLEEVLEKEE